MLAFDPNVTWQASQPFGSKAAPQNRAEEDDHHTDHHQKFPELAHGARRLRELGSGTRLSLRWQCSSEITTKHWAFLKPQRTTRSGARFGNWRANITQTSRRIRKRPRKNSSKSMRPTKS